jgi:hypothetical protein
MPDKERIALSPEQDIIFFLGHEGAGSKFVVWITDVDENGNVRIAWQFGKETLEDCPNDDWEGILPGEDDEWDTPEEWADMVRSYGKVIELFIKEPIWEV